MHRKIILFTLLCLWQTTFGIELEPYASEKITEQQWSQYHEEVQKALGKNRSYFKYEAGELENYYEPVSYTNIAFTTPGHNAHPAWVATQIVVNGQEIVVHIIGYYAGDETAYRDFYQRMDMMVERSLKKHAKQ